MPANSSKNSSSPMFDAGTFASGAAFDPAQVLQDLAGDDPRMAMLLQMMQRQRGEASNDDRSDERDELIAELSERLDAAEARLTKMTRIARGLQEARAGLQTRLGYLAAALGACGLCWGEDAECPGCRGRGTVGMVRPDPQARAELFGKSASSRATAVNG